MKKTLISTIFTLVTSLCLGQIDYAAQLKNANTYEPIESAFVRLKSADRIATSYSTPNGTINFDKITPGKYQIAIHHPSFKTYIDTIELTKSANDQIFFLLPEMAFLDAAIISSVRARNSSPTTFTNLDKKEIESLDQSKDFPFLLNMTPSTVISSDAGNGVGYTGIRIRGIDPTRVNITVNGIPINDAESQGMYWVNMPDIATSTQSVQIQRGIGTSTNGAAAFGASVNIRTNELSQDKSTSITTGLGSFNTQRISLLHNTGKLENNWAFQVRGSMIQSDGYIDRASSDLKSANLVAAKYWEKSVFKTNILLGKERTNQAWYGIPQPKIDGNAADLNTFVSREIYTFDTPEKVAAALNDSRKTYNYYTYENEVDNYNQNHYQFFFDHSVSNFLTLNTAVYMTTGKGYFEQFKHGESFVKYGIDSIQPNGDTAYSGDLIRRRWLDNILTGAIANVTYKRNKMETVIGGGYNQYKGRHFGEAIATQYTNYEDINGIYYDNDASKTDGNIYLRSSYNLKNLIPYVDLQYRKVGYSFQGIDDNSANTDHTVNFGFFNPKIGLTYLLNRHTFYSIYARGNREPVRNDFQTFAPRDWKNAEQLDNIELGYRYTDHRIRLNINLYNMDYKDQLVLVGSLNDVGEANRTNVTSSYRRGMEMEFQIPLTNALQVGGNATFSQNKIASYTEQIADWDAWPPVFITQTYSNTDISFSPNTIVAAMLSYKANKNFTINASGKYVGKQYLDNTQSDDRSLDAFTNVDLSINYVSTQINGAKNIRIGLFLNNVLNQFYSPNGYTYSGYFSGERQDFNYLFPMAGFNGMVKVSVTL